IRDDKVTGVQTCALPIFIEVSKVAFGYGGTPVFQDVSFAIRAGELVALCGPNGAGKSTLLRLLLGLHAPSVGRVTLGGTPIDARSEERRVGKESSWGWVV